MCWGTLGHPVQLEWAESPTLSLMYSELPSPSLLVSSPAIVAREGSGGALRATDLGKQGQGDQHSREAALSRIQSDPILIGLAARPTQSTSIPSLNPEEYSHNVDFAFRS